VLALCSIAYALSPAAGAAPPVDLSEEDRRRLAAGEVVLLDALPPGAGTSAHGGTAVGLVRASPETVWRILVDYAGHTRLYPRVVGVEVLEADERHALIRYLVGIGPLSFQVHMDKQLDARRRRVEWRLAEGHANNLFRESSGYWQVDAAEGASLVTYAMAVRTILPAFVTRRAERDSLVETIKTVRKRAGEMSARNRRGDRALTSARAFRREDSHPSASGCLP
jgi:hypothetical protein